MKLINVILLKYHITFNVIKHYILIHITYSLRLYIFIPLVSTAFIIFQWNISIFRAMFYILILNSFIQTQKSTSY